MFTQIERQHIEITPGVCGGRPRIAGSRIRVQDVYVWHELQGKGADQIVAEYPQLTVAGVYAALAYFWDHRDQILHEMKAEDEFVAAMQTRLGPSPLDLKLQSSEGGSAPVSS